MATKKDTKSKPVKKATAAKAKDLPTQKNPKGGLPQGGTYYNHSETLV